MRFALLTAVLVSSLTAEETPFLAWPPAPKPPVITMTLSDGEYQKRTAAAEAAIKPLPAGMPPTGGRFHALSTRISIRSQGAQVGDVVSTIDGIPVMSNLEDANRHTSGDGPEQRWAVWLQKDQVFKELTTPAGKRRQSFTPWIHPLACFERIEKPAAKWSRDLKIACATWESDPPLAWNALARAEKNGCHTGLLRVLACAMSFQAGAYRDVYGFGSHLEKSTFKDEAAIAYCLQYSAALCDGRWASAHELVARYNAEFHFHADDQQAKLAAQLDEAKQFPVLKEAAPDLGNLAQQDHAPAAELHDYPDRRNAVRGAPGDLMAGKPLILNPPPENIGFNHFGPAGNDVELRVAAQLLNDGHQQLIPAQATVTLIDDTTEQPIISIRLRPNGVILYVIGGTSLYTTPFRQQPIVDSADAHSLRIIVIGQHVQIERNGIVIARFPCVLPKDKRQIFFKLESWETNVKFSDVTWRVLGVPGAKKGADDF